MVKFKRWLAVGLVLAASGAMLLSACGGGDDDDGFPDGGGSEPTATNPLGGGNSGGGGGGGGDADDMTELANDLEPPNSTEISRFSAADGVSVGWDSKESVDSLKDFYDDKLDDLGLAVAGTMDSGEVHTWVIENAGEGIGGGISIAPSGNNSTIVTVTFSKTN